MSKSERRYRQRLARPMLAFAALAALAVVLAPTGSAKPPTASIKLYDVCLQGGTTACTDWTSSGGSTSTISGASPQVTLNVKDESGSNTTLGSLNLNMPSGVTLQTVSDPLASTSTSTQLQLRNLNLAPGTSHPVTFTINAPSVCGTVQWSVAAKQSNDFNGTGNDFLLKQSSGLTSLITNGCHLAWIFQPASAVQSQPITDTPFTSSGANVHSVTVEVQDASNNPINLNTGTATLAVTGSFDDCTPCNPTFTGTTSTTFSNGRATFPNFQSAFTGTGFTAVASALGLQTPASSPSFVIEPNGVDCVGQDPCVLNTTINNSEVGISGNGGNFLFLAVSSTQIPVDVTAAGGGCAFFTGTGLTFQELDSRNGDGTLDITLTIPNNKLKTAYGPNHGNPSIPICAGVRRLDAQQNSIDCRVDNQGGFADTTVDPTTHLVTGDQSTAVCGSDGYWWGILGNFQDPNPPYDSSQIPLITTWGGTTTSSSRTITTHVPADWDYKGGG